VVIPKSSSVTTGARTLSTRLTLTEERRRKLKQYAMRTGKRVSPRGNGSLTQMPSGQPLFKPD
jgi:hypothetical protein